MTPWCADQLIQQRKTDLTAAGAGRRIGGSGCQRTDREFADGRGRLGQRLSVWCGYRMINLGSRLLRPALVAGAGA